MSLIFPTYLPFPLFPVRPPEGGDEAEAAFFDALREFLEQLQHQHAAAGRYFEAAGFLQADSSQDDSIRTRSENVSEEAISAVIKNIEQPLKREYVWDATQGRWILRLIPA